MNYENFKTGMFRVCIFLTILMEALAFAGSDTGNFKMSTTIFGIVFDEMALVVWNIPIFIWMTYFFSLWIYKGFLGKK